MAVGANWWDQSNIPAFRVWTKDVRRDELCDGTVELMLANLVHRFDWGLPPGKESRDIDVSHVIGLVVRRKEKLLLVLKLRVY